MKAKIKVRIILCLIIAMVTTLLQIPTEVKAHVLCETCFAEKQAGGAYEYQRLYLVDLSDAVTEYVYNGKGLLVEETNPLGEVTVYTYDAFERLVTTKTPDGTITNYAYTADGQVAEITARKVTGETEELHYRYTPEGYLAAAISEATTDEYTYTEQGEVASVTRNGTYRLELSYDEAGNLVELKELSLDGKTRESVTTPTGAYQEFFYDAFGIRSSLMENGVTTQYMTYNGIVLAAYNANGERTEHYSYGKKILARE